MRKSGILVLGILILSLIGAVFAGGCAEEDNTGFKVVTSTSLIAQIVERIGGGKVNVVNIIPPAQCPGHFDVTPGDIQKLADASLFFIHNWQGEKFSTELIASADNDNLVTEQIEIAGNWMTPPVQQSAADVVAEILGRLDPDNAGAYNKAAGEYKAAVAAKESEIKSRLAGENLADINVLCDEQQAGFVKWTGLTIITTYGRPETFTPQIIKEQVDKGRAANVTLVIDNMQTGGESGISLAEQIGARHITLSNFPGGYDNTDTWEKAIDKNIELILGAVGK